MLDVCFASVSGGCIATMLKKSMCFAPASPPCSKRGQRATMTPTANDYLYPLSVPWSSPPNPPILNN